MMQTIIAYPKITVIRPQGPFNASKAVEFQRQMTTAVVQQRYTSVLIDLEEVEFLDSAGLMVLIYSLRLAQAQERRFSLCSVPPQFGLFLNSPNSIRCLRFLRALPRLKP